MDVCEFGRTQRARFITPLQIFLRKQLSRGFQFSGNYTYSHSIDSDSTWQSVGTTVGRHRRGRRVSRRTRLNPALIVGTPFLIFVIALRSATFGKRLSSEINVVFVAAVLGGWQWSGIWSFQSGAHWSAFNPDQPRLEGDCSGPGLVNCVNEGGDYNLDGETNDRPNAIANHIHATHSMWADGFNLPDNFFSAPCLGCVGDLGRNTFVGPGYWDADISLLRNFFFSREISSTVPGGSI